MTLPLTLALALVAGASGDRTLLCRPRVEGDAALARPEAVARAGSERGKRFLDYGVPCQDGAEAARAARRAGLNHAVSAVAEGRADGSRYVLVLSDADTEGERAKRAVDVAAGADAVRPVRSALDELLKTLPPKPGPKPAHVAAWAVTGAGVAAVAAGAVFASQARDAADQANAATDLGTYVRARDDWEAKRRNAAILSAAGGAAIVAGLTLAFRFEETSMKRQRLLLLLLLGVACGDVHEKAACSSSLDCPTGEWCASAEGELRCWADAVAPVASDVTLTCDTTPCLRDGMLRVEAAVADDHEVLSAEARLDLDPARPIPLTRSGARWAADVPLRDFAFERFEGPVTARITGIDGAKTRSAEVTSGAVQVTRLRWEYTAANALTVPAVMEDGTAVMGIANNSNQLLAVRPDGTKAWSLTVGTQAVKAAPAVGTRGVWSAGQDGLLCVAALDGSGLLPGAVVQSDGPIDGSVAIMPLADEEWGLAGFLSGRMVAVNSAGTSNRPPPSSRFRMVQ